MTHWRNPRAAKDADGAVTILLVWVLVIIAIAAVLAIGSASG